MNTLETDIVKLLNAGFNLEIKSDGSVFTATIVDGKERFEESNISLPALVESLVTLVIIESKAAIINAKQKLMFLDPTNLKNWSDV